MRDYNVTVTTFNMRDYNVTVTTFNLCDYNVTVTTFNLCDYNVTVTTFNLCDYNVTVTTFNLCDYNVTVTTFNLCDYNVTVTTFNLCDYNVTVTTFNLCDYNVTVTTFNLCDYNVTVTTFNVYDYNVKVTTFNLCDYNVTVTTFNLCDYNVTVTTFNLCDYNVTVTTYRHPLLLSNTNVYPVMLGPVIIHSHKTYESYYTLPSNIIRFKPQLKNIFVVGTDHELNLYKALLDCFQAAIHLLCTIHIVDAIKREYDDLGINPDFCIQEIIGIKSGSIKMKGLIDATSTEEFKEIYSELRKKWMEREGAKFAEYMDAHKKNKIKEDMRADIRTSCCLGDPPIEYDQNAN